MARSRRSSVEEGPENHERWLISYADFITLLFAFFVIMYSISSVNEGKYRVLSDSLDDAFAEPEQTLDPIQIGEIRRETNPIESLIVGHSDPDKLTEQLEKIVDLEQEQSRLRRISEQIEEVLSPYIDQELIDVKQNELWIEVEMKSAMLFGSGSADLSRDALPVLQKIGEILRHLPNTIHVEGYTDNRPIHTIAFPSNWELSAGRAASVVSQLSRNGVKPERMAAIGYGEFHPVANNTTQQGRYKNRRVVLVLLAQSAARHKILSDERSKLLQSAAINKNAQTPSASTGNN